MAKVEQWYPNDFPDSPIEVIPMSDGTYMALESEKRFPAQFFLARFTPVADAGPAPAHDPAVPERRDVLPPETESPAIDEELIAALSDIGPEQHGITEGEPSNAP